VTETSAVPLTGCPYVYLQQHDRHSSHVTAVHRSSELTLSQPVIQTLDTKKM